jgi:hypothetical protein
LAHREKSQRGSPWEGGKKLDPDHGVGNCGAKRNGFHDDETPIFEQGIKKLFPILNRLPKIREGWFQVMEIHGAHGYLLNSCVVV